MEIPKKDFTVAEFFAGIGLMRLGLEQAGLHVVWANDIDAEKRKMYRGHFADEATHFALEDVHQLDAGSIPRVTLATASFPCNDLSLAGSRAGLNGEQSGAFWGFVEVLRDLKEYKPPLVLLENVAGFLTSNGGADFRDACLALNELGYTVDAFLIDASHFVPQSRLRLFVVGSKRSAIAPPQENPGFFQGNGRPAALADFILWHPEIDWAVRPLPTLPRRQSKLASILEDLPPNSAQWWSLERAQYLLHQMSPKHRALADAMIIGESTTYGTVFRRVRANGSMAELRIDGVAGCLRTPRGGSGRQILFAAGAGHYAVRLLTGRECARLMGAEDFVIDPTLSVNQALFGFGDAVCVPVVRWIAEHYLVPLWTEMLARPAVRLKYRSVRYGLA